MKYPYGIVSDIHFHNWSQFSTTGHDLINSRLKNTISALLEYASILIDRGGDKLYIAGDVFHVRGSVVPSVLNPVGELMKKLVSMGLKIRIIPGNHDLEGDTVDWVGSSAEFFKHYGCIVVNRPTFFADTQTTMIPWIADLDELRSVIGDYSISKDLIIHAPLNGVIEGIPDKGLTPEELSSFDYDRVFCGHYHNHKRFSNEVYSIGALTHQTWSDVDTLAGGLLVYQSHVEHCPLTAPKFVDYEESLNEEEYVGNYVRIKLAESISDEKVKELRGEIFKLGAAGVIAHTVPRSKIGLRSSAVSSTGRIEESVSVWIEENFDDRHDEIYQDCLEILTKLRVKA